MARFYRFHLYQGRGSRRQRTTVSIDAFLADLLAVKLEYETESDDAHVIVREYLQEICDREGRECSSFDLKREIFFHLVDPKLLKRYLGIE